MPQMWASVEAVMCHLSCSRYIKKQKSHPRLLANGSAALFKRKDTKNLQYNFKKYCLIRNLCLTLHRDRYHKHKLILPAPLECVTASIGVALLRWLHYLRYFPI